MFRGTPELVCRIAPPNFAGMSACKEISNDFIVIVVTKDRIENLGNDGITRCVKVRRG